MGKARKILVWVLIAFAVYAVFHSPGQAASVARGAMDGVVTGLHSVGSFFNALLA